MALDLPAFLVGLSAVVAGAGLLRWSMQRLGQPAVLGDLLFGLAVVAALLAAASLGKVAGAYLGGRAAQMTGAAALVAGILLNARGAVGLVVAKVGIDAHLLTVRGYAALVVMIVVTTMAAPPALHVYARRLASKA